MTAIASDVMVPDAVVEGSMIRSIRFCHVQARLTALLLDRRERAGWWVDLVRQLDDLGDTVTTAPGDLVDVEGFAEQLRSDAPHLMSRWAKLAVERERLLRDVREVRMMAGSRAGDPGAVPEVCTAVRDVLARARRFQERTTEVLLDAYERDMGGE